MNMKSSLAMLLLVAGPALWAADDGAALYKTKCAACHGAHGEGKPAMKAPALKGTAMTVDQLSDQLTKGASGKRAPHNKAMSGLNEGQAAAIAGYVKTLQ